MQVSEEFFQFCRGLHQDFVLYGPQPRDWIAGALQFVRLERLPLLRAYINDLLTSGISDADLQRIYRSTDTDLAFADGRGVREFLGIVRDVMDGR